MIRSYRTTVLFLAALVAIPTTAFAQAGAEPAEGASGSVMQSDRIARVQGQNTSLVRKIETPKPQQAQTRTHKVVDGDTLWQLSSEYLSDPFMWPAL